MLSKALLFYYYASTEDVVGFLTHTSLLFHKRESFGFLHGEIQKKKKTVKTLNDVFKKRQKFFDPMITLLKMTTHFSTSDTHT